MSPFIQFFCKVMHICAITTSLLNAFHFSIILCGKLYFPVSFTHCLILIFFTCPLVLLAFSVTSTRSSYLVFFFFQRHLQFNTLLLGLLVLFYLARLAVLFPSAFLHMLGPLVLAPSL
ncbi:hypothetical protein E2C01_006122 [Portunus trituberculatus]|uniref:Uncharacterized protein n=1 Tax=Portunus trituberculatus TaxID=210409 RepID=A0A5B7CVG3_PORTR|nr:hypothetical protein [Portunus trituberculatus]